MIVNIIDSKPLEFKTKDGKEIKGFHNYFINDFRGDIKFCKVFCQEDLKGYSVEIKYSKLFKKFSVVYENIEENAEEKTEKLKDEDLPF